MNTKLIIRLSGRASQIPMLFNALCKARGNIRIEELAKETQ